MTRPLPDRAEVRKRVLHALTGALPAAALVSSYSAKAQANDLFEAFLFATLLDEAASRHWDVSFEDPNENPTSALLLRASPGNFVAPSAAFTHAVLARSGAISLEVHVGVGVTGESGTVHEADVLVLPKFVAQDCRTRRIAPSVGKALMILEAKYVSSTTLPLGYGRGMLGLDRDLRSVKAGALVSSRPNPAVDALLKQWGLAFVSDVLPWPGVANDARLRTYLRKQLSEWEKAAEQWKSVRRQRG